MNKKQQEDNGPYFDPQLHKIWLQGAQEVVTLMPLDRSTAMAWRHRLYRHRVKMQKNHHADTPLVNSAMIKLLPLLTPPHQGKWCLKVYPMSLELGEALATVTPEDEPPPLD